MSGVVVCTHVLVSIYTYVYVDMYMCVHAYIHNYIYICIWMYICVCNNVGLDLIVASLQNMPRKDLNHTLPHSPQHAYDLAAIPFVALFSEAHMYVLRFMSVYLSMCLCTGYVCVRIHIHMRTHACIYIYICYPLLGEPTFSCVCTLITARIALSHQGEEEDLLFHHHY